jgi:hypothetical protein
MKKLVLVLIWTMFTINVFGQAISHRMAIEAGCSVMDEGIGPQLGTRYMMGVTKHLDLSASLSLSNGILYDDTMGNYHSSGFCSATLGIGGHVDFLSICSARLLADGGVAMCAKNDIIYLRPTLGGTAMLAFRVAPAMEIGLYYSETWMFYSKALKPALGGFGVLCIFKLY